nr:ribonuclease H-like domain-containing protein [Tanacetum cinerariifolium]
MDNVFQAEDCDAFDSDVDEAPTTQTMFMANLSSADPITDEAGPSYDSDILSEVQDHDQYLDDTCTYHEEHVLHDSVQLNHGVDLHADYTSVSNMIPYDQYVKDNEVPFVHSNASSIQNDTFMMIYNDMCEPSAPFVSNSSRNVVVKNSVTAELATYREQVELYERREKFELTEREQKINEQLRLVISDHNFKEETLKLGIKDQGSFFFCALMPPALVDNLGKFKAKGDGGYFIGYSMSSKAFRMFNKRTRRVEENLHVEFLENKAIEKGVGPNWLFDIDSLTKSMNYAGTNSTNFSGTKDAANQKVKKDVSSLRYIALPNWAHDAFLESSSSKPHDASSNKVPEGSRNLNPTASSSNPLADQMETLTVESPIPTVSSPVPTACLNDSPEPSSEARLILKRVANQEETPSLDNILSLTNRYEDILGVTTSSDEAIGMEADIIGPVDTPIQTRHKSKEVEEQSFIATIYQKTDPALLQFCLFSCFLSQVEPKKVSDALQDPLRPLDFSWPMLHSWASQFQDPTFPEKVYKVEKALYGLHQAPRAWYGINGHLKNVTCMQLRGSFDT